MGVGMGVPDESATDMNATGGETSFADLGLRSELLDALSGLGYEEPTPIQREAIPPLLEGRDLLGQAATGTGKTAAFALPLLQRMLHAGGEGGPDGAGAGADARAGHAGLARRSTGTAATWAPGCCRSTAAQPIGRQLQALERGVDVVVATPGRALDHIGRGTLRPGAACAPSCSTRPTRCSTWASPRTSRRSSPRRPRTGRRCCSRRRCRRASTAIARRHLRDPVRIEMGRAAAERGRAPLVRQSAYVVARAHKPAALGRVLDIEAPTAAIVFCRTRDEVDQLTETLNGRGYRAEALHGGMEPGAARPGDGRGCASGTADLLIATDVAARGLDIEQLTHVVNYDVPSAPEAYVHRIGRVGRAGREGVAITLAEPREHRMLKAIERLTKQRIDDREGCRRVADLRARRLELTRAALEECLLAGRPGALPRRGRVARRRVRPHGGGARRGQAGPRGQRGRVDEQEIPEVAPRSVDQRRGQRDGGGQDRERYGRGRRRVAWRACSSASAAAPGIRPQDLVGAIAGESSLSGRDIGAIEIADRFSLVEVPQAAADEVIDALRRATIKGRRPTVRRERDTRSRRPR